MKTFLKEAIKNREFIFFDGGMGTYLQAHGLKQGQLPETFNLDHPEVLKELARLYLEAGANIVNTNTFGANRMKFPADDSTYPIDKIVTTAVENTKEVRDAYIKEHPERRAFVALDIGPTGKLLAPMGTLDFEEAVSIYKEVISLGAKAGADLVLIETMSDSYELKAAVLAAKEACDLPVIATVIFSENGKLLTGGEPKAVAALLEGLGVDALGVNCGLGPKEMKGIVHDLAEASSVPVIVNPNAGLPRVENGVTYYDVTPEDFAETMKEIATENNNVLGLGGCCGTTPKHIEVLVSTMKDVKANPIVPCNDTVVSSGMGHVVLNERPIVIGERINPTGKKKMKQALVDDDMEYILNEGVTEEENGAHILDVNVGLPEIDEPAMLKRAVYELQGICALPLQIDTTDMSAMEGAMRIYNGKPMINSVNGKQEMMDALFPLVKKYGGVVVSLLLDEDGIPDSVEGRIKIAEKIYANADKWGIPRKDIVFDALVMTISTDSSAAKITLDTVREITERFGACSVLGVSNVSFGLPRRDLINTTFYSAALNNGLTAGIINPSSKAMMAVYRSFLAVKGYDEQCLEFIDTYAGTQSAEMQLKKALESGSLSAGGNGAEASESGTGDISKTPLGGAIVKGLKDKCGKLTEEILKNGTEPLDIINEYIVPALDVVGQGFEKNTIFLPQLLMSAEAAQACFEVIKTELKSSGVESESKGKVIVATVKGDIHDIGKNIVKVLLENYSFEVIDLGKDVPPEVIVETAQREHVHLIGLSALMTTTVVSMEDTIKALHAAAVPCEICVGGAVLNQEYADMIGADAYCKDAMQTVRFAEEFFDKHPEYVSE
ncbi:MAG: homocysteine S-methyltransferase family protein [Lachnospiraceae bacterium]|nr:homocysteine S-methyltransferase family protein [Lachnospiraceae bacterium]